MSAPALGLIRRYYAACNSADRAGLLACFCDDVVLFLISIPFGRMVPGRARGTSKSF